MFATRTKRGLAILALGIVSMLFSSLIASAHGYTTAAISRQKVCANRTVANCGEIIYEPQSVEGLKGFPNAGPANGRICSGGLSRFAQLDDPRGGGWPATRVSSGQRFTFSWTFTAMHSTTNFRYFITNNGWNSTQPLTRSALNLTPFLTVPMNGARPGQTISHAGTLPARTGKHIILATWDVADTGNAFYACSDVQF
jgi:predicted carbohydrate-binding protein with CBM5 and CBM33 domain